MKNDRKVLNGKELDIYIPSKNLAIEYNGLYWHSDKATLEKKMIFLIRKQECMQNTDI